MIRLLSSKVISNKDQLPWFYQIRFHILSVDICSLHALSHNDTVADTFIFFFAPLTGSRTHSAEVNARSSSPLKPALIQQPAVTMLIKESDDFSDLRVGGSPPRLTPPPSFDFIDNGKRDYPRMPAFQLRPVFTRAECEMIPEEEESPRRNPRLLMKSWVNNNETMPSLPKGE